MPESTHLQSMSRCDTSLDCPAACAEAPTTPPTTHDVLTAQELLGDYAGQAAQHVRPAVNDDGLRGEKGGQVG